MSDKCLLLAVRVPLLPRHGKDSDPGICGVQMLFLGYRIPRIALGSSSTLGDVCLCVWILTLEGMFCFRVCLGKEHAHSELRAHLDESWCLGSTRVCSYSRGMRNKVFVSRGPVPPLPQHSFSPRGYRFDLRDPHTLSKRVVRCHRYYWVVVTMKCEHGVVSALILRDRGQSYIQLGRASLICMLLCGEPRWA